MNEAKYKAIIIGDYANAMYHPLKDIDNCFNTILSGSMDITLTEDRDMLELHSLDNYDLCISYVDSWEKMLSPNQMGGLISFIAQGGGFLSIHNGISYQKNPEYAQILGGKFTEHPPYQKLCYTVKETQHPITEGIQEFALEEELYMFDFDKFSELTVLMECTNSLLCAPAAWIKQYGLGRVVYLAPGHDIHSFQNTNYQEIILRSALWAVKAI